MLPLIIFSFLLNLLNYDAPPVIWVDQFDNTTLETEWKGRYEYCDQEYKIEEESGNTYLAASSKQSDCFIVKKIKVDLVKYPYLNWKWRTHQLPVNGDESVKAYCDVSASITLVLNKSKYFPKSMKYTWSTTLEPHHRTESPFAIWPARCDIHVLQSGSDALGKWVNQKVNLLEDYKNFYDIDKIDSKFVYAVVIMTDADNTLTPSAADYDDLFFSRE